MANSSTRESPPQPNEQPQLRRRNIYDYDGEYGVPHCAALDGSSHSSAVRVTSALATNSDDEKADIALFSAAKFPDRECPLWVVGSIGRCNTSIKSRPARVSKPKVSRNRSLSCRATRLSADRPSDRAHAHARAREKSLKNFC